MRPRSFTETTYRGIAATLMCMGMLGCNLQSAERVTQPGDTPGRVTTQAAPNGAPGLSDLPTTRETAQATPGDIDLTGKVESALSAETALKGSSIAVSAADGVVTLTGSTKDPELRSMAAQVALSVAGVRSVRNELTIAADV